MNGPQLSQISPVQARLDSPQAKDVEGADENPNLLIDHPKVIHHRMDPWYTDRALKGRDEAGKSDGQGCLPFLAE